MPKTKICTRCVTEKPLTEAHWYKARPTNSHPKGGWQSNCKDCWKIVNRENKQRRKGNTSTTDQMSKIGGEAA